MKQFGTPVKHTSREDENITDLLLERHRLYPGIAAFEVAGPDGRRAPMTSATFLEKVRALAKGLLSAGIQQGEVVAIMSRTRFEWVLVDWAVWFAGGVSVSVYETSAPSQVQWIAADAGARFAIVESTRHAQDVASVRAEVPSLETIWVIDDGDLETLAREGEDVSDDDLETARTSRRLSDTATLIYTSGTTGRPKGAQLSHGNFVDTSRSAITQFGDSVLPPGSRALLFLPMAHVFARLLSVTQIAAGATTAFTPDTTNLLPDLADFKPTFLLAVPRVFEKVYNGAEQKAIAAGTVKAKIFAAAATTAVAYSEALSAGRVSPLLRARHALFDRLVYSKLRDAMGGDVRWSVSGGAPLGRRISHFFRGIGVTILEGYGLTETTAPVTVNPPWDPRPGTVGQPLPGVTVAISEEGEVLVKGVVVFQGYHNNPEATAASFTDGWYRTGDIGSLDEDGFLEITGRSKELIVTAGGKNVSPAVLEDRLRAHPVISQCMVVGDQKPFIAAIVTLDAEMLPTWLRNKDLGQMTVAEAATHEAVRAEVDAAVATANEAVSRAESIRVVEIIDTDFTEENGYLTPSLKLKRNVVSKDYAEVIERIYSTPNPTS